jgi:hypothetical protein
MDLNNLNENRHDTSKAKTYYLKKQDTFICANVRNKNLLKTSQTVK